MSYTVKQIIAEPIELVPESKLFRKCFRRSLLLTSHDGSVEEIIIYADKAADLKIITEEKHGYASI